MQRLVIVNPASAGGRTARRWPRIVEQLGAGAQARPEVWLTERPGHGVELARRAVDAGFRELVVLGGDGTIGEVVAGTLHEDGSGATREDVVLSIVHQGTGGDLARGLGVPVDEAGAIAVATAGAGGDVRAIDVGVARFAAAGGGEQVRGFVSTANVGMAADVVEKVTGRLKRIGRSGAFAVATVGSLARNHARAVRLTADDGVERALSIVDVDLCNNRFMGGGMLVAPDARLDDGMLDVVVISAARRTRLLRTFPKIYSGRHVHDPLVEVIRTATLRVTAEPGGAAQGVVLDGELVGTTPVTFTTLPGAIRVRVPQARESPNDAAWHGST